MNVFLGEPSDTVISYVDKRYYKHTVDAMNNDVSACYKVCEEKSAVIPAEKTSSNLSATIQSIQVGYTSGDLAVPVTGNITGVDSNYIAVQGSVQGGVCGSVGYGWGTAVGSGVLGDIHSDSCGVAVLGSVNGNICGGVCGYISNGNGTAIYGGVCGDIMTNNNQYAVYGTVYGDIYGGVCGYIGCGYGTAVCGDVCGNVCGNVCGSICGWFKPENVTTSTVLTLDQTSGNNVLLNIDVCGKQYYIHAN